MTSASAKTWRLEFPSGVSTEFIADVVKLINDEIKRSDGSPEAVAFLHGFHLDGDPAFTMSEFELVNFRCDSEEERRFLIISGPSSVESISNASKVLLRGSFPKPEASHLKISDISGASVQLLGQLQAEYGYDFDRSLSEDRLSHALSLVSAILESDSTNSIKPWNVLWFEFVEASLERLVKIASFADCEGVEQAIYPAFGLPNPSSGGLFLGEVGAAAKMVLRAYGDWWSSWDKTVTSAQFIANRVAESDHFDRTMLHIDEEHYVDAFALNGDSVLTFLNAIGSSIVDRGFIGSYPQSDLLTPRSLVRAQGIEKLQLEDRGCSLGIRPQSADQSPYLVPLREFDYGLRSDTILVYLKPRDDAQALPSANLEIEFDVAQDGCEWITEEVVCDISGVRIRGHLVGSDALALKLGQEFLIQATMTYELPPSNPLSLLVQQTGKTQLVLAASWGELSYLGFFDSTKASPKVNAKQFLPEPSSVGIDSSITSLGLLVRGNSAKFEGTEFPTLIDSEFFGASISISEQIQVDSGNCSIQLFKESQSRSTHSPIIAAISKEMLPTIAASPENATSIRGRLEDLLSENISNESWLKCLFHVALEENQPLGVAESINTDFPHGILCAREVGQMLSNVGFGVDPDFVSSSVVSKFVDQVKQLDLEINLTSKMDGAINWPSKTSWRHLYSDSTKLNELLTSFEEMVSFARDHFGESEVFWASYPFSTSVWNAETGLCSSVLLSPLHPLRLAWIASVEHGLWEAQEARQLAGTIEGWDFPMIGPAPQAGSSMLAVPTDHGTDYQFLGWSMLVPINSSAQGVVGPNNIAGFTAPGNSSTGLNASASVSAVKSYRRVNPHLSSLVIDLAVSQGSKSSRLTDLDEAIHEVALSVGRDSQDLPGGIHVLDSLSRLGEFPRERILQTASSLLPRPFSWRRYQSTTQGSHRCQIRLLQDPGVHVRIERRNAAKLGTLAEIPFRRFVSIADVEGQAKGITSLAPRLSSETGWIQFRNAVEVVEAGASGDVILSSLNKPALADGSADWTVSGEGLLSPSTVAALLAASSGSNQMLWEWRPPFLDSSSADPSVSKRAFMTIARVPNSFKLQLASKLSSLQLSEDEVKKRTQGILETLGGRGMGLAALLAMGGTHTSGAIGFYAAFKVLESIESSRNLLVIPMDACDGFLRSLAGTEFVPESGRKADLLAIDVSESVIRFIPIEIKMYGLDQAQNTLPGADSRALDEAKQQAVASLKLLRGVLESHEHILSELSSIGDKALWLTNLAALIDTARKLSPKRANLSQVLPRLMQNITSGNVTLELGTPMVNYFTGSLAHSEAVKFRSEKTADIATLENINVLISSVEVVFDNFELEKLSGSWGSIAFDQASLKSLDVSHVSQVGSKPTDSSEVNASERDKDDFSRADDNDQSEDDKKEIEPDTDPIELHNSDECLPGLSALIGVDEHGNKHYFHPSKRDVVPQLGVIGASGSGKTQLMKRVLFDLAVGSQAPWPHPGILILDYKGDFSLKEDDGFRTRAGFETIPASALRLNFWELSSVDLGRFGGDRDLAIGAKASSFKSMLQKMTPSMGLVQASHLTSAIKRAYQVADQSGRPFPPMSLISSAYAKLAPRADVVSSLFESVELIKLFAETTEDANDLNKFFAPGKKQIIDFSALGAFGDPFLAKFAVSAVLESLVQNMYSNYSAAGEYDDQKGTQKLNQIVFIDEAHNIIPFGLFAIDKLIREGRSFGHGIMMATQGMAEFAQTDTDYREMLSQWCVFRVTNPDQRDLAALGFPVGDHLKLRTEINSFQTGQALYRRFDSAGGSQKLMVTKLKASSFLEVGRDGVS
ncbi:DUF87 domain-containing protein [Aquiluna sp. KACHI24]|uniref:ATP-binding protein n=1 Tax=Aquiluna sp. KACHI24 TaxID=2968831 RepID=UPI00222F715A|nr:DUF87 domain-containing protein [Aquiluna sp. KACHI24]